MYVEYRGARLKPSNRGKGKKKNTYYFKKKGGGGRGLSAYWVRKRTAGRGGGEESHPYVESTRGICHSPFKIEGGKEKPL